MYGDKWKTEYPGVYDLPDKGVNAGTWNIERFKVTEGKDGAIFVDEDPLVCYHFHGLKIYLDGKGRIRAYPVSVWNERIYSEYMEVLQKAYKEVLSVDPTWNHGFAKKLDILRLIKQTITKKIRLAKKVKD